MVKGKHKIKNIPIRNNYKFVKSNSLGELDINDSLSFIVPTALEYSNKHDVT